jgi:arginase
MSPNLNTIHLIGSASGVAAADAGCWEGPLVLEKSDYLKTEMANNGFNYQWDAMLQPNREAGAESPLAVVTKHCEALADAVGDLVRDKAFFTVFGGDHSCAIGTWSGVHREISKQGDFGLIWIDAHMDSHTPETSETGNIHGMPLACLLGYGNPALTELNGGSAPKIKAEHVCVIGARSFEEGEEELLKDLNIRIYFMDEVERRGLKEIMTEAIDIVNTGTVGYGVTIDIDSIDPAEAPGTGVSEPGGLSAKELCNALTQVTNDKRLIGTEIVEFDPRRDKNALTEKLSVQLLISMLNGKLI